MAVGTKRTRLIVLGGRRFRWRCQFNHPAEVVSTAWAEGRITTPDRLLVRPEVGSHQILTVEWPPCTGPVVKPRLVRVCVELAEAAGWLVGTPTLNMAGPVDLSGSPAAA